MNLALFDFDGTIASGDSFTDFLHFAVEPRRLRRGKILLSPVILFYKMGILSATSVRAVVARYGLRGRDQKELESLGSHFSGTVLEKRLIPTAMKQIAWHKERGDHIVVVSASLDVYMTHWCKKHHVSLICTTLEVEGGTTTGRYVQGDCSGKEKARRVLERYDLKNFTKIYAYGDTKEDFPMLELADEKYYRWRKVKTDLDQVANMGALIEKRCEHTHAPDVHTSPPHGRR